MKKIPCIRGLKEYKRHGCPCMLFNKDTGKGCPAWIEIGVTALDDPNSPVKNEGHCVDIWNSKLLHDAIKRLAGVQQATESFRNNMSTEQGPKPDPAVIKLGALLETAYRDQQLINNAKPRIV